jgi:hypothetical protein
MRNKPANDDDTSEVSSSTLEPEENNEVLTPIAVAVPVPVNSNVNDDTPLATSVDLSDREAGAAAAAARQACVADIRNHCDSYLQSNQGSASYVTWIATLHPENASVQIDPRFKTPGNPWLTVFEEAKEDFQKGRQPITASSVSVSPSAPDLLEEGTDTNSTGKTFSGFLDLVIGATLALTAILTAFAIEICAAYCYLSYWLCDKICEKCKPVGIFSWLPFSIAYIIGQSFRLIDILLLFVSVIIVESISAMNYLLCTIFACSHEVGKSAHQMTRRLSHHIRWAFRRPFKDCEPKRSCFGSNRKAEEEN